MNEEIWRDVVGYEGLYQVSNLGRVYSVRSGKVLKFNKKPCGYNYVQLSVHDKRVGYRVHRLVAQAFIPNTENKPEVNHINGIKTDNRVENLEWCTRSENEQHKFKTLEYKGSFYGKHHSEKTRKKLSDFNKVYFKNKQNIPMYGKHHTEDTKRKLSEIGSKKVICIELNRIFKSCESASLWLGLNKGAVGKGVRLGYKTGGYTWKYYEEES